MNMSTTRLGDAQLLAGIATGEQTAFKTLIAGYYSSFIAIDLANNLSFADAEDAVGYACMKLWSGAGRYHDQAIEPKYWLRPLMRHALRVIMMHNKTCCGAVLAQRNFIEAGLLRPADIGRALRSQLQ